MSFDEHPFRLKKIHRSKTGVIITVVPILNSDPDNIGIHWEPSGLGYNANQDLELIAFESKWNRDLFL